jgi:carbon starvation protein
LRLFFGSEWPRLAQPASRRSHSRGEAPSLLWFIVAAVCLYALGYRFYSAFITAKVLDLDNSHLTPAIRLDNGLAVPSARFTRRRRNHNVAPTK